MKGALIAEPSIYVFDCLNALFRISPDVRDAFATINGEANPGLGWLGQVNKLLRSPPDSVSLFDYVRRIRRLRESSIWDDVLNAISSDAAETTISRREREELRSLWGISPIISLIADVQANRMLGIESESLVFTTYITTKDFDISLSQHVQFLNKIDGSLRPAFEWLVLIWALYSYDIFFYYNDRGILEPTERTGPFLMGIRLQELSLLRKSNKFLYTQCIGSDYRTRKVTEALGRFNFCMGCPKVGAFCFCDDDLWPNVFHTTAAYATAVTVTGLARYQIPWGYHLDAIVVDTCAIKPAYITDNVGRNLRVVHIPNHAYFKGTAYLMEAIERLKKEGAPIELQYLTGITNSEVLSAMREADIVVDQLIGGYFGLTALEAMALGKPVIVYLRDHSLAIAQDKCPLINANPDTIYDVLKRLIATRHELPEIGQRSRRYVEEFYSTTALVPRLRDLYAQTAGISLSSRSVKS
jgi:hypothetical protein